MKKHMICATLALALAVTFSHNATAQSVRILLRGNIPFAFEVGGKVLPAGNYEVLQVGADLYTIRSLRGDAAVQLMAFSYPQARTMPESATLVFHRYGNRSFLSEVWRPAEIEGIQFANREGESSARGAHAERQIVALVLPR